MWVAKSKSRTGKSGVVKIQRHTYNTVSGFAKVSGWWEIRDAVFKRDGGCCVPCKRRGQTVVGNEVHHIVALTAGGTTTMGNLLLLCQKCHDLRHRHLFRARGTR